MDSDRQNRFNKRVGFVSLLVLAGLLAFSIFTFQPITSGGQQHNALYQVAMFMLGFLSSVAVVPIIGIVVGFSSQVKAGANAKKVGAIALWLIAVYLLVGTGVFPKGGDSMIGLQTIPMALLYFIFGIVFFKRR